MAAVSGLEIAPEALSGVQDSQAALQEEADRLAAVGDPLATSWATLASAGKASNRLLVDVFLKTQKLLDDGRKPWTRDEDGRWCSNWTRRCCTAGRRSTGPGSRSGLAWRCCSVLAASVGDTGSAHPERHRRP